MNMTTFIHNARIMSVSLVPYKPGYERYGIFPIYLVGREEDNSGT